MAHIVIIGASYAGIAIAHSLLKDVPSLKITLINPSPTFFFTIAAPRILAKRDAFRPEQYLLPIEKEFSHYAKESFEFIRGRASAIDASSKTVSIDNTRTISFDYLVIASGSTTASTSWKNTAPIPFKQSNSDNMTTLIRNAQDRIDTAQNIVIGGAGPIGVELAGEIAEAARLSKRKVSITLVSASYRILPMLKPAGSAAAEKLLVSQGVKVLKNQKVTDAVQHSDSGKWTVILEKGQLDADLYIPTTGVLPNNEFIPAEFLDEQGWVVVDKELRVKGRGKLPAPLPIFAAGDITNNSMRLSFKAQEQAAVVASNLKAEILGQGGKRKSYDQGDKIMMIVPVGSTGGTGLLFGWTPWSAMVKLVKGKDFLISRAKPAVAAK
jgi:NADH dehydrogenase FAD-containing subunit